MSVGNLQIPALEVDQQEAPPRNDTPFMGGTFESLILRYFQCMMAIGSLAYTTSTTDFSAVNTFRFLVFVVTLQILWSGSLGILDLFALFTGRSLQSQLAVGLAFVGDLITSTLMFAAVCGSLSVIDIFRDDLNQCSENHCKRFNAAIMFALVSWLTTVPSFFHNYNAIVVWHN